MGVPSRDISVCSVWRAQGHWLCARILQMPCGEYIMFGEWSGEAGGGMLGKCTKVSQTRNSSSGKINPMQSPVALLAF